jgi:glycerol-3-phosphate O-acyltransferase/dihydroxyacetone phosphate acyltransferase
MAYNRSLLQLNIRDHQVENASLPRIKVLGLILYRLGKLALLSVAVLPGLILFSPVFVAGKLISIQKSKEALAASTVKIKANDVMATWKLLVSLVLAPILYVFYDIILGIIIYKTGLFPSILTYLPRWFVITIGPVAGFLLFAGITYAALRFGEIGMDIAKSLRPLFVALSPHHGNMVQRLRARRQELALAVTQLINELGPEMFPDFEKKRIVPDTIRASGRRADEDEPESLRNQRQQQDYELSNPETPGSPGSSLRQSHLPRNESLHDLSSIDVFASRPATPYLPRSRSRTNSFGGGLLGFSPLEQKGSIEEVSRKVRDEMRKRPRRKRSESAGWESDESSTSSSPGRLDGLTMTSGRRIEKDE